MGNCCSSGISESRRSPLSEQETSTRDCNIADEDDHDDSFRTSYVSTTTDATLTPFLETPDTMAMESQLEERFRNQLIINSVSDDLADATSSCPDDGSSGKAAGPSYKHEHQQRSSDDPRLIHLLEFFRNLYMRKKGLFRKVISIRSEELVDLLNKVGKSIEKEEESNEEAAKFSLQKSLSVGAKSLGVDEDQFLKNKRFKFKTVDNKPGGGGSGGTAATKAGGGTGGGGGGAAGGTETVVGGGSK